VDIISDGIAPGSIQVPSAGTPIIMMADRQTTGGYAKIATVIGVDLPKLAQRMPGDAVRFQKVTIQEAQKLYRAEQRWRQKLKKSFGDR
jgi:allophanate hydrolase subunit 2